MRFGDVRQSRKWCVAWSTLVVIGALTAAETAAKPPVVLKPGALAAWNVVLITLDATSAQRIGTYTPGMHTMPYFDELARTGVVYEHAYTTVGDTAPSHATILSGAIASKHGVSHNGDSLEAHTPWLATNLHAHGYFTTASTVAFFIDKSRGFAKGFDHFITIPADKNGHPGAMSTNAAAAEQAAALFENLNSRDKTPFFCWIHLKGGHGPLVPIDRHYLEQFDRLLPASYLPPQLASAMPGWLDKEALFLGDSRALARQAEAYYDANLAEADAALKRVVEGFRSRGLAHKTLFIVTADHGESFDHGLLEEHGSSPWESTLRSSFSTPTRRGSQPLAFAIALQARSTLHRRSWIFWASPGWRRLQEITSVQNRRTEADAASSGSLTYDELLRKIVSSKTPTEPPGELKNDIVDLERTGNWAYPGFVDTLILGQTTAA